VLFERGWGERGQINLYTGLHLTSAVTKGKERIQLIERGSTRLHSVENWLWKGLWNCHKADCRMNGWVTRPRTGKSGVWIPVGAREFFPKRPGQLLGLPSLLFSGSWGSSAGVQQSGGEVDHSSYWRVWVEPNLFFPMPSWHGQEQNCLYLQVQQGGSCLPVTQLEHHANHLRPVLNYSAVGIATR
jgi:hypothetical protein